MKPAHSFSSPDSNAKPEAELSVHHETVSLLRMDRETWGRLRRELLWTLGEERMHGFFARSGLSCGLAGRLESPQKSMVEGLGHLMEKTLPHAKDERIFECSDSAEADEHLRFFDKTAKDPQCWFLAGYLTGGLSAEDGEGMYVLETRCRARGDAFCRFVAKPRDGWGAGDEDVRLEHYIEDNVAVELASTRELLKLTKDRYQNLFEQSSTPIFIVDPDTGLYLDVNFAAEELTGYTKEELLRMNVFDIRPVTEHSVAATRLKNLASGHPVADEEMLIRRKDGADRVVDVSSKTLDYGGQRVIQTIARDITDLKTAAQKEKDLQDQLLRSERLSSIGRLAAGVAHEIKNPLGAIRNAVYYLRSALMNSPVADNDPQVKEIIKLAEEEVDGAVRIIEELLDFSRVVQLIPRRTQINEVIEKLPVHIQIPENVKLNLDLDVTLPMATVDPDRLIQVFSNIATNAIQAMPNGGSLTIKTRLEIDAAGESGQTLEVVTISFEDTGDGIHPQHLKKIFEPLFTTKARGTGLGLAITNNIVEKHGGAIVVTSQIRKGTVFTVKLPLHGPSSSEESNHGHKENPAR